MTLWRRAPREVYRVYGEDECLAENEAHAGGEEHVEGDARSEGAWWPSVGDRAQGSLSGRLIGLGLLVGVTVGAFGLVLSHTWHRVPATPPRRATQGAEIGSAPRSTAGVLTDSEPATGRSTVPVSRPREPAPSSIRTPRHQAVRSQLRLGTLNGPAKSTEPVEIDQFGSFASRLSEPGEAVSRSEDEFGFER